MVMIAEGYADKRVVHFNEVFNGPGGANKFGVIGKFSSHKGKKGWLMDGVVTKQCSSILKKLMTHEAGWIFNQPVDPVKLKIPDYFSIISEPMDLGTVRSKLERGLYFDTDAFAADVRLTFSNAMRYNPPYNDVHIIAKELNDLFNLRWKSLETMWRGEGFMTLEQTISKKTQKQTLKSKRSCHRTSSHCSNSSPRRSMAFTDKQILRKYVTELLDGNPPPNLLKILRKFGTVGPNRDRVNIDFDALDDKVLWELNKIVKSCPKPTSTKPTAVDNKRGCGSGQELLKGKVQSNRVISSNAKSFTSTKAVSVSIEGSYEHMDHCSDFNQVSSSGRKDRACNGDASNLVDRLACNNTKASCQGNSNPDFDVIVDLLAEENVQLCSGPPIAGSATITEGSMDLCYDEQLSPSKALRAATLRSRFADTILKATLLNNGGTVDAMKMQQERERLQKREQEVKAKMEEKIRAAKAAARDKAEAKLKMQREREREAARLALQKMEKTVDIDDNKDILKDLEMLVYNQSTRDQNMAAMAIDGCHGNLLEQLGLFMKNDDMEDEADSVSGSS